MQVLCKVSEVFGPAAPEVVKRSASLRHDCSTAANSALAGVFEARAGDSPPDLAVGWAVIRLFSLLLVKFDLQKYGSHPKDNHCCPPSVNQLAGQDWGRIGVGAEQSGQIEGAGGGPLFRENRRSAAQNGRVLRAKLTE